MSCAPERICQPLHEVHAELRHRAAEPEMLAELRRAFPVLDAAESR
jgi:hypothetical protein